MTRINKGQIKVLDVKLFSLPTTIRCSLSNCPSNKFAKKGGELIVELVRFDGLLRLRKGCRQCGVLYEITAHSPNSSQGPDGEELITREEAAHLARVSPSTISRWAKTGKIKGLKAGRSRSSTVRYRKRDVQSVFYQQ